MRSGHFRTLMGVCGLSAALAIAQTMSAAAQDGLTATFPINYIPAAKAAAASLPPDNTRNPRRRAGSSRRLALAGGACHGRGQPL